MLAGHDGEVFAVDVSPDGRLAATGSLDYSIKIWDLSRGALLRTLMGHTDLITGVAFTGDGRRLISVSMDKTAKVWDVESGREMYAVEKNRGLTDVAMVPVSGLAVFGSEGEATVFDLPSGKEVRSFPITGNRLCSTPDGRLIVWNPAGFEIRSVPDGQLISRIETDSDVNFVRALPNGRHAVSAHPGGLRLWDLTNGAMIRSVALGTESPTALAITPDGTRAFWGSERGGIYSWPIDVSVSRAIPAGHDRLRLAYLAVLESPELWRILETWDESALAGIGPQVGCPPDQDVLEMLATKHPDASPPALWAAWMETLHKSKLGKPPEAA
jgi:WD40 repeat protein